MTDINRRNFGKEAEDVFDQCEGECFYCHKELVWELYTKDATGSWNADHLIPYSRNSATTQANGVAACWNCNSMKSDMTHVKFIKDYGGTETSGENDKNSTKSMKKCVVMDSLLKVGVAVTPP